MDKIPVNKRMIPYRFNILLGSTVYTLAFHYNAAADLFTVSAYRGGKAVCLGEPLVYGVPLWSDCYRVGETPAPTLIPVDESGGTNAVTWDNFGETVFLCIDDEGQREGR